MSIIASDDFCPLEYLAAATTALEGRGAILEPAITIHRVEPPKLDSLPPGWAPQVPLCGWAFMVTEAQSQDADEPEIAGILMVFEDGTVHFVDCDSEEGADSASTLQLLARRMKEAEGHEHVLRLLYAPMGPFSTESELVFWLQDVTQERQDFFGVTPPRHILGQDFTRFLRHCADPYAASKKAFQLLQSEEQEEA